MPTMPSNVTGTQWTEEDLKELAKRGPTGPVQLSPNITVEQPRDDSSDLLDTLSELATAGTLRVDRLHDGQVMVSNGKWAGVGMDLRSATRSFTEMIGKLVAAKLG